MTRSPEPAPVRTDLTGPPALEAAPPHDGAQFRGRMGLLAILAGLVCLALLFFVKIPEGNKEAVMLAMGLVLGWGGTVISYEFGSSPSGRAAAQAGIRKPGEEGVPQ